MAATDLIFKVGANITGFRDAMADVNMTLNRTLKDAEKGFSGFDRLGGVMKDVGTSLSVGITAPLALASGAAIKFASDFELGMRQVTSLLGNVTQDEFKALSDQTLELAKRLGIDAVEATRALYEAISAGIPKENALQFIEVASTAAIAGLTDTGVAVDALTTIIAAYGLEITDAKAVSDVMFQAVKVGKFQFEDLAAAIGPAAQQASNLGISYEELMAATATLSITSGGVSIAVTQIESAMRALLDPTTQMKEALKGIGFESGSAAVQALGLEGTLQKLRERTGGSAEAFNALFGRIEGANAALGLTGPKAQQAAIDLETMRHASDGLGASQDALNQINQSTARQFDITKNELKATAIEMGQVLLPAVKDLLEASKPLIQFLADAVKWFSELPQPIQTATLAIVGIGAAIGPVLTVGGNLITAFTGIAKAASALPGVLSTVSTAFTTAGTTAAGAAPAITGMTTALTALKTVVPLAAAAFAGWKLGEWLADMDTAKQRADDLRVGIDKVGKSMKQGEATAEQYQKALQSAGKRIKESAEGANNLSLRIRQLEQSAKSMGLSVSSAGLSTEEYAKALQDAITKTMQLSREVNNASDELAGHSLTTAAEDAADSVDILTSSIDSAVPALSKLSFATGDVVDGLEIGAEAFQSFVSSLDTGPLGDFTEALQRQRITSTAELRELAEQAAADFKTISDSGVASAGEIEQAEQRKIQAARDYAEALGDLDTAAALDKQLDAHRKHGTDIKETWNGTLKQVSTIFTDFSKKVVDDLFAGKLEIGGILEDIGKSFARAFVEDGISYLNTFVEKGLKWVMSHLEDLLSMIPGVGSALGSVFGSVGSATGSATGAATSAAGTGASAASGVAGGFASVVSAVANVGSLISGVFGNFQMAGMAKDLGEQGRTLIKIENYLGSRDDGGVLGQLFKLNEEMAFGTTNKAVLEMRDYMIASQIPLLGEISYNSYWSLMKLENIDSVIQDVKNAAISAMADLSAIRVSMQTRPPAVTVTIQGNVIGNEEFLDQLTAAISQELQLQGA